MGVRLDVCDGSELGIDVPGSTWGAFQGATLDVVAVAGGTKYPDIIDFWNVGTGYGTAELAVQMGAIAAMLPDGPDFAEGAHRALALRFAKLAKAAAAAGKGLVWS